MAIWSPDEDATLRSMYATSTREQIAKVLGRTKAAVRTRCWTLGLASKSPPWTDDDVAKLLAAYGEKFIRLDALAKALGRDKANICRKARGLGLTDQSRKKVEHRKDAPKFADLAERHAHIGRLTRERFARGEHPRGMAGKKHTASTLTKLSDAVRQRWADPSSKFNSDEFRQGLSDRSSQWQQQHGRYGGRAYSRCRKGARADLGDTVFLSRWEANYARYLTHLQAQGVIASWAYEPRTFLFEKAKRGTRSYTPDFLVTFPDGSHEWHEVKGWMDEPSKARIERLALYYPDEKLVVIGQPWFKAAARSGLIRSIPHWETDAA